MSMLSMRALRRFHNVQWVQLCLSCLYNKYGSQGGIRTHTTRFLRPIRIPFRHLAIWYSRPGSNRQPRPNLGHTKGISFPLCQLSYWSIWKCLVFNVVIQNHFDFICLLRMRTVRLRKQQCLAFLVWAFQLAQHQTACWHELNFHGVTQPFHDIDSWLSCEPYPEHPGEFHMRFCFFPCVCVFPFYLLWENYWRFRRLLQTYSVFSRAPIRQRHTELVAEISVGEIPDYSQVYIVSDYSASIQWVNYSHCWMMQRNGYLQDNTAISVYNDLLSSYVTKIRPILDISALSGTTYSTYLASFQTLHSALWTGGPLFCHHGIFQRSVSFCLLLQ